MPSACKLYKHGSEFEYSSKYNGPMRPKIRIYTFTTSAVAPNLNLLSRVRSHFEDIAEKFEGMDLEDTLKTALDDNFPDSEATHYPVIRRGIPDPPYMRTCGKE